LALDPRGEIGVPVAHLRTRLLNAISIARSIAGCAGFFIGTVDPLFEESAKVFWGRYRTGSGLG
jgi:hypothetical protein